MRAAVKVIVEEHRLSRVRACKAVGQSRSVLHKPTVGVTYPVRPEQCPAPPERLIAQENYLRCRH